MVVFQFEGIIFECNPEGIVTRVVSNQTNTELMPAEGRPFPSLMSKESRVDALDFMVSLRSDGIVTNRTLAIQGFTSEQTLVFWGLDMGEVIWIVGVKPTDDFLPYLDQLQQINNEQSNHIRTLLKQKYIEVEGESGGFLDEQRINEISMINNQLVNLQRELQKKNSELERINMLKNQFLGMAAHDLRNPLGAIMSFSELLMDESAVISSDSRKKFLGLIHSSSEYMLALIEDLLNVSVIETGKLNLQLEKLNLRDLISNIVSISQPLAARKGIRLVLDHCPDSLYVMVDMRKMEQVLHNLIANAVKFSFRDQQITLSVQSNTNLVNITIQDEGVGMSEEQQAGLFIPFTSVSNRGTAGEMGTGLGLYIVKRIVEGHGGRIGCESEPGRGSQFTITLPVG